MAENRHFEVNNTYDWDLEMASLLEKRDHKQNYLAWTE